MPFPGLFVFFCVVVVLLLMLAGFALELSQGPPWYEPLQHNVGNSKDVRFSILVIKGRRWGGGGGWHACDVISPAFLGPHQKGVIPHFSRMAPQNGEPPVINQGQVIPKAMVQCVLISSESLGKTLHGFHGGHGNRIWKPNLPVGNITTNGRTSHSEMQLTMPVYVRVTHQFRDANRKYNMSLQCTAAAVFRNSSDTMGDDWDAYI